MKTIVTLDYCTANGVTPNQLLDIADWHEAHAELAIREKDHAGAERHKDIVDRLCVRASQLR